VKTRLSLLLIAALSATPFAHPAAHQTASAASLKYHEYRTDITEPPYGLAKVKALVKGIKAGDDEQDELSPKLYNKLSFNEKFTYTMIHGGMIAQNCDIMPVLIDENKKIFGHPPDAFSDETGWSEKQISFLDNNRTRVIGLIRSTMNLRGRVGANLKQAIVEVDGVELIPDLTQLFNKQKKDFDILTVMMLLMEKHNFGPFVTSATHKKLYGPNSNYQSFVVANDANQKLTLARAAAFYKSWKK
jgi:hypothetical protein